MRIAVFGAGGVGGYFGGRLAQAGQDVTFIARGAHLQAMLDGGLRVNSLKGDFVVQPVQATANPAEVGPVDAVIIAVKAWQIEQITDALRPLVGPDTFIVPLQNGVETPRQLASVFGAARVVGGFCRIVSFIVGPGHIRQAGGDPTVVFGELDNQPSERTQRLLGAFQQAQGVIAEIPNDIQAAMWSKFLLISAWSGMGAITRAPVGVWRSLPETRQMWQQAMREVLAVARAHNIALPDNLVDKSTNYVDSLPPHATASMQRDVLAGRPSELDTLCGGVVRLGREAGVATPTQAHIYHSLLPQEMKARGRIEFPQMP
ncbi:MAG: 2-dehydropantoate 2-reductase [Chloroflexi bacterium]|nr:MAG: 2-dehydropantoate 2-reductase [Chloroflexota bacterium]